MAFEKTNHSNYFIDKKTNVVINKNVDELQEYKMKVQQAKELKELRKEVKTIKDGFDEIKELLKKALG